MEGYIAEIRLFGGNFAPRNWAFCEGQILSINEYTALFSLLGTTYGGDGRTTFALPDLRGAAAMHPGQGPGQTFPSLSLGGAGPTLGSSGGAKTLALNYIICLQGLFPSRS